MPFCFHGFWFPPVTNFRILVAAFPWRWLARNAFTAWCITGMLIVPSNSSPGNGTADRGVPSAVNVSASNVIGPERAPVVSCGVL